MSNITAKVKWGKEKYDVDIDVTEDIEVLHAQLFALTNVPVERQKLLAKGKVLKTNEDLKKLKDGVKLMLMGSADALPAPSKEKVVFEEDLTHEQKTEITGVASKVGLVNLGNTCYMNSSLQCLRNVPELNEACVTYSKQGGSSMVINDQVTAALGRTFASLDTSGEAVAPHSFLDAFRMAYPQFAERGKTGQYAQQDAEECLSQLLSSLSTTLKDHNGNIIDDLFGIEFQQELKCVESESEEPVVSTSSTRRLQCHIDINTNFLHDGLLRGLTEDIDKRSASLGREAKYTRTNRISKLPKYLIVQFVRFFWRADTKMKAKIMRKVTFPPLLDVEPYCEQSLAKKISACRKKRLDEEDRKMGLDPLSSKDESAMDVDEKQEEIDHEGFYELNGVVTHQGRYANGGHYIGWARQKGDDWIRFDDDEVTHVKTDDVKNLSGGGDWHMAYLLVYKLKTSGDQPETNEQEPSK